MKPALATHAAYGGGKVRLVRVVSRGAMGGERRTETAAAA